MILDESQERITFVISVQPSCQLTFKFYTKFVGINWRIILKLPYLKVEMIQ